MLSISSINLSIYIIAFFDSKGDLITNKKLQKLLYFVQAWHLAYFKRPIIDEEPEAWRYGPVFAFSYHHFKEAGYSPLKIKNIYDEMNIESSSVLLQKLEEKHGLSENQYKLIKAVLLKYGGLSAHYMEILSHQDPAWIEQRKGLSEFANTNNKIPNDRIKKVYLEKLKKMNA